MTRALGFVLIVAVFVGIFVACGVTSGDWGMTALEFLAAFGLAAVCIVAVWLATGGAES